MHAKGDEHRIGVDKCRSVCKYVYLFHIIMAYLEEKKTNCVTEDSKPLRRQRSHFAFKDLSGN